MREKIHNVLFHCIGNSARSNLAEVLLEHRRSGRFQAYSAGSFPKGAVHPLALDLLEKLHLPTNGLRSKSWNEFARPGWIVSSPSATRPRKKCARSGLAIR